MLVPVTAIVEGFRTSRLTALKLWRTMSCSFVIFQVFYFGFPLSTFITLRTSADSMLHPHVLAKGIGTRKRCRTVRVFTFQLLCTMSSSLMISQTNLVFIFLSTTRFSTGELHSLQRETNGDWIHLPPFGLLADSVLHPHVLSKGRCSKKWCRTVHV